MIIVGRKECGSWQIAGLLTLGLCAAPAAFAQFVVVNTSDGGAGSLRQAILDANANPGPDTINFDIPGAGQHVIQPISPLPEIVEAVLIDGYSQPASQPNIAEEGSNAIIQIVLDGSAAGFSGTGLVVMGLGSEIKGLAFINWQHTALELGGDGVHAVRGNWFGVAPDGSSGRNDSSIRVSSDGSVIGGPAGGPPAAADRNLISNSTVGIFVGLFWSGTRIVNNAIGTSPSGTSAAGNVIGLLIHGRETSIGGLGPLEENVIAWSRYDGVTVVHEAAQNNTIRGNRIFNNGELGIDLVADSAPGVTENDPPAQLDGDSGPNGLQNFPVLTTASNEGGGIRLVGVLDSAAGTTFDIDFYSNTSPDNGPPDSAGRFHGEGEAFLGTIQVTTDVAGHAEFDVVLQEAAVGPWISSTATDPAGNTSEFSTTVPVAGATCTVTNEAASGAGSFDGCLDQAAKNGNHGSAVDFIIFDIPGAPPFIVPHNDFSSPFSPNLVIDFTSQPGYQPPTPGNDPCDDDAVRPVTVDANGIDLILFDNNLIDGMNLLGRVIFPPSGQGMSVRHSNITASAPGPAAVVHGDLSNIVNTILTPNGTPRDDVIGSYNRFTGVCGHGLGIHNQASNNTFQRFQSPFELAVFGFAGTGNTFSELKASNPAPLIDGPINGVTIDLGSDGHTENDPLDADQGPNDLQNHPVILSATALAAVTEGGIQSRVQGILDSEPGREYRIEAYANSACAANDYGPAERYLGFSIVTTDETGRAAFSIESSAAMSEGEVVVASATGPWGSTSELSACVPVGSENLDLIIGDGFE